jgi:hypothetical protein
LDALLKNSFNHIDSTFCTFYKEELNRLKKVDALHKYSILTYYQEDLLKMFETWRESQKSKICSNDMDTFYYDNVDEIIKNVPEIKEYICLDNVKKNDSFC